MILCNPIIPGFAPDPSIVRIEDNYYLVNSSFHLFPGLPIFHSKDLKTWKHIGNAISRSTQIDLTKSGTCLNAAPYSSAEKAVATGGLYAPTIRHRNGVTYIVCTNVSYHIPTDGQYLADKTVFENFVISTCDINQCQWSDPVYFDFYGIDPDLFFDDDGRTYVSGSSWESIPSTIKCFEIDIHTGRKLSEERVIWQGHTKIIPEGPHIYKRGGYYYLLDAEGGTHKYHCTALSRSRNIWGPYESFPDNPILKPSNISGSSQYHGHCDLFQDHVGDWWVVCLGVRRDSSGRMVMGRETFLQKVRWPDEQPWPFIEQPIPEMLTWRNSFTASGCEESSLRLHEAYPAKRENNILISSHNPTVDMVWIRKPQFGRTRFAAAGKTISILPSEADLCECTERSACFVGKRQRLSIGSATVQAILSGPFVKPNDKLRAGLAYYKDEHRYARVFWDAEIQSVVFEILNRAKCPPILRRRNIANFEEVDISNLTLYLRAEYTEALISFSYCLNGDKEKDDWKLCADIDTLEISGPDFTGPVIGLFATGVGNDWCQFDEVVI